MLRSSRESYLTDLNARFVVGQDEASVGRGYWLRFIRDRRTGDCYITVRSTNTPEVPTLTKTDDNACEGF